MLYSLTLTFFYYVLAFRYQGYFWGEPLSFVPFEGGGEGPKPKERACVKESTQYE